MSNRQGSIWSGRKSSGRGRSAPILDIFHPPPSQSSADAPTQRKQNGSRNAKRKSSSKFPTSNNANGSSSTTSTSSTCLSSVIIPLQLPKQTMPLQSKDPSSISIPLSDGHCNLSFQFPSCTSSFKTLATPTSFAPAAENHSNGVLAMFREVISILLDTLSRIGFEDAFRSWLHEKCPIITTHDIVIWMMGIWRERIEYFKNIVQVVNEMEANIAEHTTQLISRCRSVRDGNDSFIQISEYCAWALGETESRCSVIFSKYVKVANTHIIVGGHGNGRRRAIRALEQFLMPLSSGDDVVVAWDIGRCDSVASASSIRSSLYSACSSVASTNKNGSSCNTNGSEFLLRRLLPLPTIWLDLDVAFQFGTAKTGDEHDCPNITADDIHDMLGELGNRRTCMIYILMDNAGMFQTRRLYHNARAKHSSKVCYAFRDFCTSTDSILQWLKKRGYRWNEESCYASALVDLCANQAELNKFARIHGRAPVRNMSQWILSFAGMRPGTFVEDFSVSLNTTTFFDCGAQLLFGSTEKEVDSSCAGDASIWDWWMMYHNNKASKAINVLYNAILNKCSAIKFVLSPESHSAISQYRELLMMVMARETQYQQIMSTSEIDVFGCFVSLLRRALSEQVIKNATDAKNAMYSAFNMPSTTVRDVEMLDAITGPELGQRDFGWCPGRPINRFIVE